MSKNRKKQVDKLNIVAQQIYQNKESYNTNRKICRSLLEAVEVREVIKSKKVIRAGHELEGSFKDKNS